MASRKKYDAVATIGEYTDRNGAVKKRYTNVGTVFENEDGRLSLKLDAVPVGQEWTGWVSFFEPKQSDSQQPSASQRPAPSQHERAKANAYQADTSSDDTDDIPF